MRHTFRGIGFFGATCVVGVIGYRVAGWDLIDAVYMVVITIFGVGYGEVRPVDTSELRIFTSGLIVTGYGAALYAVGGFVQFVTEGEINRALGARRMTKEIKKMEGHTIVCGYGRVGRILTERLRKSGCEIVAVDQDPAKILEAEATGLRVVTGDAAEESVLMAAGIEQAAQLAAVLPSDSANVFVTLTATGITRHLIVIARAEDPASEKKLMRSGADHVILPAAIGADRIANLITRPSAQEILAGGERLRLDLGEELEQLGLRIEELTLPSSSSLIGKPVRMIEIGGNHGFLIVGLVHPGGEVDVNPDDGVLLREGDKVTETSTREQLISQPSSLNPLLSTSSERACSTHRFGRVSAGLPSNWAESRLRMHSMPSPTT
jgi:voltage-gated potassium channel